jgi:hypothetical protein
MEQEMADLRSRDFEFFKILILGMTKNNLVSAFFMFWN